MKSDELTPGSQEWHYQVAIEILEAAKDLPEDERKWKEEMADFHKRIGEHQPKGPK